MCFAVKFVSCHLLPRVVPQRCVVVVPIIIMVLVVVGPNPPKCTVTSYACVCVPGVHASHMCVTRERCTVYAPVSLRAAHDRCTRKRLLGLLFG